jgi:hypothetical protein
LSNSVKAFLKYGRLQERTKRELYLINRKWKDLLLLCIDQQNEEGFTVITAFGMFGREGEEKQSPTGSTFPGWR